MIALPLAEVAALCAGRLDGAPGAESVTGVQVDSRRISPGDLFVAVGAGETFVADALARGAAAALVPEDALAALAALAGAVRARSRARVVGITGSTGKTSTKDILAAICAPVRRTVANEGNLNNEIGVPLTLCRLEPDTDICILELAMRGPGQIAELCAFAKPDVGVITNVGPAHVGLLGSLEAIVRAKAELVEALRPGATAIVPAGFPVERDDLEVVRLGEPVARVEHERTLLRFQGTEIAFDFTARHQARNALAALHAAAALGVAPPASVEVTFSPWRGEEVPLPGGGLLVNDAYNANPVSMRAALEHLVERAAGRRTVAVLGDMAELGAEGPRYHREIAEAIRRLGIDVVFAVGPLSEAYVDPPVAGRTWWSPELDPNALIERLRGELRPGDAVLVKGSRAAGLEAVALALAGVER
ncbi:MAG TPA: UDP-N-acetylmuramoyl-tripeptide--D-alanyl-D-alanine ligase [Gaiellaceae bacterium]|nr:UDP-N-acetylmuramoyl-tripeptide--D-alanyl-D-alanine ligase [Gaiellaceae bacterium]